MKPLEYAKLPETESNIDIYVNGKRCTEVFNELPYIKVSKLWLPVGEIKTLLTDINISEKDYVEASVFSKKYGITLTWEPSTKTVYIASIMHYDGYCKTPENIIYNRLNLEEYNECFYYLDAELVDFIEEKSIVILKTAQNTPFVLSGPIEGKLRIGNKYRFCYQYRIADYEFPIGVLMEIADYGEHYHIGNMEYTKYNWHEIINESGDSLRKSDLDYGISEDEVTTLGAVTMEDYSRSLSKISSLLRT